MRSWSQRAQRCHHNRYKVVENMIKSVEQFRYAMDQRRPTQVNLMDYEKLKTIIKATCCTGRMDQPKLDQNNVGKCG